MRIHYLFIFIIFLLNIESIKTICVPGENCPIGQGVCINSECVCEYRYQTLHTNETNQIYCNYRLINRYFPLILEFIAPSVGLLYMGRINHGFFKLFCVFIIVLRNGKILGENFFTALISTIFFFLYVIDLFCILFLIYTDGNGMPLY